MRFVDLYHKRFRLLKGIRQKNPKEIGITFGEYLSKKKAGLTNTINSFFARGLSTD